MKRSFELEKIFSEDILIKNLKRIPSGSSEGKSLFEDMPEEEKKCLIDALKDIHQQFSSAYDDNNKTDKEVINFMILSVRDVTNSIQPDDALEIQKITSPVINKSKEDKQKVYLENKEELDNYIINFVTVLSCNLDYLVSLKT